MTDLEWDQHFARCLGVYLSGAELDESDERGRPIRDDDFLLLINAHHDTIPFRLPAYGRQHDWFCLVDTAFERGLSSDGRYAAGSEYPLQGRSLVLLMRPRLRPSPTAADHAP